MHMSGKPQYEVVSLTRASNDGREEIQWVCISKSDSKLCPFVVLDGQIFHRLSAYHLIKKDLNFAMASLEKLLEIQRDRPDQLVEQSLWCSAVVSYGKCFTEAKGRKVKLEANDVFKTSDDQIKKTHEDIMHERHQYIAHAGVTAYEQSDTMLALSPDVGNKRIFGLYHSMYFATGIGQAKIESYIPLMKSLVNHVESVLDKLFPAALKEVKKADIEEWYRRAAYPMEDIPNRAMEANLTAPTGGVLREVLVRVEINPPSGSLLIYGAPGYDAPVRLDGPIAEGEIPTTEPRVFIQKLNGAEEFKLWTLGYRDART